MENGKLAFLGLKNHLNYRKTIIKIRITTIIYNIKYR